MLFALARLDYAVIVGYIALLAYMGWHFARRQKSTDEYFLASRSVPWFALGLSIMATLMSSLTYLSEPGEVWLSGLTTILGKWGAVLTEMVVVLVFIIPFLMRFRFTSAYEYLGYRFGPGTRLLGVSLFVCLIVSWMGFVVMAMSWTVSQVTGVHLWAVTATVGVVGTVYTMVGGMRAVIWKEVLQVLLMMGGCLLCMAFVSYATGGTWVGDWLNELVAYRRAKDPDGVAHRVFTTDPFDRITIVSFGVMMFVWNLCTHLGNQMVVQRYFSSGDLTAARRSFVVAACASLLINTLLILVGVALIYFYEVARLAPLPVLHGNDRLKDLIFPSFMVNELPPGLAGAVLIAVLSAAMSTIDSGINAVATVLSVERRRVQGRASSGGPGEAQHDDMTFARMATLVTGLAITSAAYGLNLLVANRNILEMMPRTFNCFLVPLGGLFFLGFFCPRVGPRAAVAGAVAALVTAVGLAYSRELFGVESNGRPLSFTLILPTALAVMVVVGLVGGLVDRSTPKQRAGLTWQTRRELPDIPRHLVAEWVLKEHGKTPPPDATGGH